MRHTTGLLAAMTLAALLAAGGLLMLRPEPRAGITPVPTGMKLDLNSADSASLMLLPGIGRSAAECIVADRSPTVRGPFADPRDLRRVARMSDHGVANILPYVLAGPVPATQGR